MYEHTYPAKPGRTQELLTTDNLAVDHALNHWGGNRDAASFSVSRRPAHRPARRCSSDTSIGREFQSAQCSARFVTTASHDRLSIYHISVSMVRAQPYAATIHAERLVTEATKLLSIRVRSHVLEAIAYRRSQSTARRHLFGESACVGGRRSPSRRTSYKALALLCLCGR